MQMTNSATVFTGGVITHLLRVSRLRTVEATTNIATPVLYLLTVNSSNYLVLWLL